jgi:hypothetical protein
MAKGQIAKAEIFKKILENFDGAFIYNDGKEIRIPIMENGEEVQIKVTLTAAKENVNPGDDNALPGDSATEQKVDTNTSVSNTVEPSIEEQQNINDLLKALGL